MSKLIGKHIKAVVFDFDDTLVATIEAKWASHKLVALKHYGKTLTDDDIRPHWGKPISTLVGLLYGDDNIERALALEHETNESFPKVVFEDTLEVLNLLHKSKKLIGLVSAVNRINLIDDLKTGNFPENIFDYTQTQEDSEFHKPDPRVFDPLKVWLKKKSVTTKEVVYVGDGLHDMKAALGAGFEFIGVTTGLVTQEEFEIHNIKLANRLKDLL